MRTWVWSACASWTFLYFGSVTRSEAQTEARDTSQTSAPLITAGFPPADLKIDWRSAPWLRVCQSVFQNAVIAHPTPLSADTEASFSPEAIAIGRRCLDRLGGGDTLPPYDWAFLSRLAVTLNDDSLLQRIVTRQLAIAGTSVHDRIAVMQKTIGLLLHNEWPEVDTGAKLPDHRTAAHTALARQYASQLDTMHPAGRFIAARLDVYDELLELDTMPWSADSQMAHLQVRLRIALSVPMSEIPPDEQPALIMDSLSIVQARYLQVPTHANLTSIVALRDRIRGVGNGTPVDSLLGHPAGRLVGDYWFPTTAHDQLSVPAPGKVTLVVFIDPQRATRSDRDIDIRRAFTTLATQLATLHQQNPPLQIVLVAMTEEIARQAGQPDDPDQDAEFISDYFTRHLKLVGTVCVLKSRYHTESGMTAVPLASPVLDGYHLDPRSYDNHIFLIDADGWIVNTHEDALDGHLIQRLLSFKKSSHSL